MHDHLDGRPIVIFHRPGALSALDDSQMDHSRAIGATGVFSPEVVGKSLTFKVAPDAFRDRQTGTLWNLPGPRGQGAVGGQAAPSHSSRGRLLVCLGRLLSGHQHSRYSLTLREEPATLLEGLKGS